MATATYSIFTTLAYGIYTSIILLLIILIVSIPRSYAGVLGYLLIISPLIWSGPYSVVAIPLSILLLLYSIHDPYRRLLLILVITETLTCYVTTDSATAVFAMLTAKEAIQSYSVFLVKDVFLLGFFEQDYLFPVTVFIPFFFMAMFRNDVDYLKLALLFITIIYSSHALFFLSEKYLIRDIRDLATFSYRHFSGFYWF